MYNHSTLTEQKETAESNFRDSNGSMRVLFCTSSFGMGVDVMNCHLCKNYGPPKAIDDYLQQSGRIGRDGIQSHAILMVPSRSITSDIDVNMKECCKSDKCRRYQLMNFIDNPSKSSLEIGHLCCDICSKTCCCLCSCRDHSKK